MLIEFDKNNVPPQMLEDIEEIFQNPLFTLENAKRASHSATGIFKWVKAIRDYQYVFKEVEPKRDAFMIAEKIFYIRKEEYA